MGLLMEGATTHRRILLSSEAARDFFTGSQRFFASQARKRHSRLSVEPLAADSGTP